MGAGRAFLGTVRQPFPRTGSLEIRRMRGDFGMRALSDHGRGGARRWRGATARRACLKRGRQLDRWRPLRRLWTSAFEENASAVGVFRRYPSFAASTKFSANVWRFTKGVVCNIVAGLGSEYFPNLSLRSMV